MHQIISSNSRKLLIVSQNHCKSCLFDLESISGYSLILQPANFVTLFCGERAVSNLYLMGQWFDATSNIFLLFFGRFVLLKYTSMFLAKLYQKYNWIKLCTSYYILKSSRVPRWLKVSSEEKKQTFGVPWQLPRLYMLAAHIVSQNILLSQCSTKIAKFNIQQYNICFVFGG